MLTNLIEKADKIYNTLENSSKRLEEFFGVKAVLVTGNYGIYKYYVDVYDDEILVHRLPSNDEDITKFYDVDELIKYITQ